MKFDRANDPNAARLIESLRYLGYGNREAIADLVDNSIDADSSHIQVFIHQRHGGIEIVVADDGSGMDYDTLDEAMKLGSDTPRNINSDLGRYGMGLVTASLSIARRYHVTTRGPGGCWSSAQDVDEIIKQKRFTKHLDTATNTETARLDALIGAGNTGTVVTLTTCDNVSNRNTTSFASIVRHHLGRVHRYFIGAERRIEVNGEPVDSRDPLQLNEEATELLADEILAISVSDNGSKRVEQVRVRIVLVPEPTASELDIGLSMKAQGFYVMRNQREIIDASTLGEMFTKHNDYNRMRGEIFFPGELDELVGIEFTKRQVEFHQSLFDQLAQVIKPICRSVKNRARTRRSVKVSEVQKQVHLQSAKAISRKNKLLLTPKARIEKRASPLRSNGQSLGDKREPEGERKHLTRTQAIEAALNCSFREEKLGPNGQIYETEVESRKIVIRYNVEHPFYQRFIIDAIGDGREPSATDFLIFSMASAELRTADDGQVDAINNFKAVMSANLRTLLN